jgi:acyl-CoA synthetase (AMP-forming)/AMP-acid ligase II
VVITVVDQLAFIVAFFSAIRAGFTPVPAPNGTAEHPAHLRRFKGIVRSAQPAFIVTDESRVHEIEGIVHDCPVQVIAAETLTAQAKMGSIGYPSITSDDPAFLQFTSRLHERAEACRPRFIATLWRS